MKMKLTTILTAIFMSTMSTGGWAATDNGDGTVTAEGLIWMKDATCIGLMTHAEATSAVKRLKSGDCGLKDGSRAGDWRLPEEYDLRFRMGDTQAFKVNCGFYWTSSPSIYGNAHMIVGMCYGGAKPGVDTQRLNVWAIRNKK